MELNDFVRVLGVIQFSILVASSLVPFQLDWRKELASLPKLHLQMYWIYGGYIVLNIVAFGVISLVCADELASKSTLARAFSIYVAIFWGIRLGLQALLDAKPYLKKSWLRAGYHLLTLLFAALTLGYGYLALA